MRKVEEVDGVLHGHLVHLVIRYTREIMGEDLVRFRPIGFLVWKIVGPNEAFDIQVMAIVDRRTVALKSPIEVFVDQLARLCLQRLELVQLLGPRNVPLY